jgi:RimJ/RimL family protein N-acetyltransferase
MASDHPSATPVAPPTTFPSAPPERMSLGGTLAVVRVDPALAPASVAAINASLDHLRPWMAWAQEPATEAGIAAFHAAGAELWDRRQDFAMVIVDDADGSVVGGTGLHARLGREGLEIGYWVRVDRIGEGIATRSTAALTAAAFAIDGIERVRITCADDNVRSARVPEKLGYRFFEVSTPTEGPTAGRPTQRWEVERADWMAGPHHRQP